MAQPLTPELITYGLKNAVDPQISPDGTKILYTLSQNDEQTKKSTSQLWLCDPDGGNQRQLTQTGKRNRGGRWSPDGQSIAFVSDRVSRAGIFLMAVDQPGEARELTHHGQELNSLAWSPDGKSIAYTTTYDPDNPEEQERDKDAAPPVRVTRRVDYKFDARGYLGDKRNQVFVVDVDSGERRMLTHDPVDHNSPQWSPDGKTLAISVTNENANGNHLGILDVASGDLKLIGPEGGNVATWVWSRDGRSILYAGDTTQTWQSDFFVYDVAKGESTRLTDDLQVLPAGGMPGGPFTKPVWLNDNEVLFNATRAGASGLYTFNVASKGVEPVYTWQATLSGLSVDDHQRLAVQSYSSLDSTGELSAFDLQQGAADVITDYNGEFFKEHPAARWERFDVQRGKYTIEAWLLKPADFDPSKKYPVVLDIHGGPNGNFGYGFMSRPEILATNGFLVVFCNPRGSSSYGREFTMQVIRDWGNEDFQDIMAVMDKALELPYADASRTGVHGYSYGGYMTSWTIGQTDRFQAAVCGAPCFDLESFYGTSDIGTRFGERQFGGPPHVEKEWYAQHSPSNFAHRVKTPTLIIHGEEDHRCPIGQGEQMFIALKKANCEVEFARYPGGAHTFARTGHPEHQVDVLGRTLAWFKDHLGEPKG